MRELFLGEYIKQERLKQGITQEQLCEGICEPITISRMENGKQTPSYNRIRAFLQRLGLPDERYVALLSKNELEIKTLQDEIRADAIRFYRAAPENRAGIRTAGLQKLEELEKLAEPDDRIIRQYIMHERATFGKPDGPYSLEEKLELLLEALRITVPNFDLEEINLGLYSMGETTLLNQIAVTYAQMGQEKKQLTFTVNCLNMCRSIIVRECPGMPESLPWWPTTTLMLSLWLGAMMMQSKLQNWDRKSAWNTPTINFFPDCWILWEDATSIRAT